MIEEVIKIFYSYSRKDLDMRNTLESHLAPLKNAKKIQTWHDLQLEPGTEWERDIQQQLHTADIILLLVSSSFMGSDYCYSTELQVAIERHNAGEARVIPVILRPCDWNHEDVPFSKLNVLPTHARPITSWPDPDEAYAIVAQKIRETVEQLRQQKITRQQQRLALKQHAAELHNKLQNRAAQEAERQRLSLTDWSELLADIPDQVAITLEQQESKQQQFTIDTLELASEKGVDYSELRDLLKAGNWREADKETLEVMLQAANRGSEGWLDANSLRRFPCQDLKTIDQLWVTASKGHFGFSVQKSIWEECDRPMSYNSDLEKFIDAVGWGTQGEILNYSALKFSLAEDFGFSPKGELPHGWCLVMLWKDNDWMVGYEGKGEGASGWGERFSSLAQRLVKCTTQS
jgi:hypothetical protein